MAVRLGEQDPVQGFALGGVEDVHRGRAPSSNLFLGSPFESDRGKTPRLTETATRT
jgi:hypothetical protein